MDRPCNFPVLLVLLLLFLFSPPPQIALGLSVKIGVLLPFYTSTKTPSYRGMRHLDALRIAIDNVNADETLLPTTNLLYAVQESRASPDIASIATKYLIGSSNVDVIIVGREDVFAAHKVAPNVVLVGHSTTSPRLSDKTVYSNFVRTCISDSLIARNIAAFIRSPVVGATHVSIISGSDEFSSDLAHSFLESASSQYIRVISAIQFAAGSKSLDTPVTAFFQDLKSNHKPEDGTQYLVLLFAKAIDTVNVLKAAHASGNTGIVTWILSESILDENDLFQSEMGNNLNQIMAGSFVVHANNGIGSSAYTSLWNEWKSMQTTAGTHSNGATPDPSSLTNGVRGTGPNCNSAVDSDGNSIYKFDDDDNPGTAMSCGGVNFPADASVTKTLTYGVPFVYDAVLLVAHALHDIVEIGAGNTFSASELVNAMKNVSFEGVSGKVDINQNGDRHVDDHFSSVVSNYDPEIQRMQPIGLLKSKKKKNVMGEGVEEVGFVLFENASMIYNTVDGTRPIFYPSKSVLLSAVISYPLVIVLFCVLPFFSILIVLFAFCRQRPGTKWTRDNSREQQLKRLEKVLLKNESFHIVAKNIFIGRTFNCHRSTWVGETHMVDVALLVFKDNSNMKNTADKVTTIVNEVHFMKKLQHPNILQCYGLLVMGSSSIDTTEMTELCTVKINNTETETESNVTNQLSEQRKETINSEEPREFKGNREKTTSINFIPSVMPSIESAAVPLDKTLFPNFGLTTTGTLASVALVLEWCEHGSLNQLLQEKHHCLTLLQCLQMASELAHSVYYLHSQDTPLAHPDLTSSNVYITIDFHVKLGGCFPKNVNHTNGYNNDASLEGNILSLAIILNQLLSRSSNDSNITLPSLNELVISMKNSDPDLRPRINDVVRRVDGALKKLQSETFAAVDNMPSSIFETFWSKDVNNVDPLNPPQSSQQQQTQQQQLQHQSQLKKQHQVENLTPYGSVPLVSSRQKKLVAPGDLHVLLVDDDDFALASMQHALEMCHYSVTGCNSGIKAMNFLLAKPNKYHVVLSDAFMPAMNGLSLLGAIQGDSHLRHIPVVLVSSSTAQITKALKLGARDYLVKPLRVFEAMTLFPKVKMWRIQMDSVSTPMPVSEFDEHRVDSSISRSNASERGNNKIISSNTTSNTNGKNAQNVVSQMAEKLLSANVTSGLNLDAIKLLVSGYSTDINQEDTGIRIISWPQIQLKRLAGMGSGGCVFEAILNVQSNEKSAENSSNRNNEVACKRFNREKLKTDNDAMKGYMRELELLSMLNHPNIMKLVGIAEHQAFVWHICEFAQFGSLGEMLQDPSVAKFLSVSKRIDILLGVANALHYMHSLTPIIIHRDVKPSNILISHDLTAKLSDFAYSRAIAGPRKMTRCGTPAYVAPEVMLGYPYDESIDTYAFGVVFWQVVTRSKPFASENDPVSILKKTSSGERCEFPPFKVCSSVLGNSDLREAQYERFIELTHLCWHQDRQARPCMMEVIKNIKDYIA